MARTTSLNEETPGLACEECLADLSFLPDEAQFCCFCGAKLDEPGYGTSGGVDLTDKIITELAIEAAEGYDIAKLRSRSEKESSDLLEVMLAVAQ